MLARSLGSWRRYIVHYPSIWNNILCLLTFLIDKHINPCTFYGATRSTFYGATRSTFYGATRSTFYGATRSTFYGATRSTCYGATRCTCYGATRSTCKYVCFKVFMYLKNATHSIAFRETNQVIHSFITMRLYMLVHYVTQAMPYNSTEWALLYPKLADIDSHNRSLPEGLHF